MFIDFSEGITVCGGLLFIKSIETIIWGQVALKTFLLAKKKTAENSRLSAAPLVIIIYLLPVLYLLGIGSRLLSSLALIFLVKAKKSKPIQEA